MLKTIEKSEEGKKSEGGKREYIPTVNSGKKPKN